MKLYSSNPFFITNRVSLVYRFYRSEGKHVYQQYANEVYKITVLLDISENI